MKSVYFLLIFLILLISCQSNQESKIYYETGELRAEGLENSNTKQGVWKVYDKQGQLVEKLHFHDGLLNFRETFINDNLAITEELKDSVRHGKIKFYYEDGSIKKLYTFVDGEQKGLGETYYPNKNLELEYIYKNGYQLDYIQYHKNGKIFIKADTFGKGIMTFYDSIGIRNMDILFKDDIPVDTIKIY